LPIYRVAGRIDNCNFGHATMWEGAIEEGETFRFNAAAPPGRQYVAEAADLGRIASERYDILLSSHALEHVANPLKALAEWRRVLKPGGWLVLVLPHRDGAFDHRRPVTTLAHMLEDFERDVGEDDLTHLDEILELHDLARDPLAGGPAAFRARALKNLENRGLHHHVFDAPLAVDMVGHAGFEVVQAETLRGFDIVVIGRKSAANGVGLEAHP
jgi:SAM-dependent methyltransferase